MQVMHELDVLFEPAHHVLNTLRDAVEDRSISAVEIRRLWALRRKELTEALIGTLIDDTWTFFASNNGKLLRWGKVPITRYGVRNEKIKVDRRRLDAYYKGAL